MYKRKQVQGIINKKMRIQSVWYHLKKQSGNKLKYQKLVKKIKIN